MNIEQKNPFIENVNKHMFNLEKFSPAAEFNFFYKYFWSIVIVSFISKYYWKKLSLDITLKRF